MNEPKSSSVLLFQSGIIGSLELRASVSIIGSYPEKFSNPYIGLKSMGSSIVMESFIHAVCESVDGSRAPVLMKVGETIGDSCLTGETIRDCRGNGLVMGGVGGALDRAKGLSRANDRVVGVPPDDELEDAWPWSDSELTDRRLRVNGAPRSSNFCCIRPQSSSNPS
jgi:hypothetical protein